MMTFYAAAGSYQIRNEDGKDMPYIMRLGKLQPVSIPEFSIWSMLLWDVLTHDELRKKYFEKMEEVKLDPSGFEKALEMLVKRKLIIKGVGYTGADALYNMLYDTYVIPLRGVQGTRRLLNIAKLLKQGKVNFFEAVYLLQPDRVELAEEAKVEDYSLLLISMPKIEQDTEFTPDRLPSALQDNDRTEWVFSRLEEQWKQKYYAVAVSPPEHGTGNLCPISFGKYKGKYSARWIDCAHCHFNVAQPPCCLCVAGAGIQKKEDFKRDLQDRLFDIDKIRRTNEEEIRLREERERSFERRSVYPRPTPYAARPVVPAGPTQEELDAEYIRICQSYDPSSEEWTVDRYNRRWIMCTVCGRIKQDAQMSYYGGKGGANQGVCADCSRNGRS